jgi:hypothetical protein
MRTLFVMLTVVAIAGCDDSDPIVAEPSASCADVEQGGWARAQWSDFIRLYEGPIAAHSDVLVEPDSAVMRYIWSAEIANWGSGAYRQPFLRSSPVSAGGLVVFGDPSSISTILPGEFLTLPGDRWLPVPPGWELNAFVPDLADEDKLAFTLGIVSCEL